MINAFMEYSGIMVDEDEDFDARDYESPLDYTDLIRDSVFEGDYPMDTIIEGLTEQFQNYIRTEDKTDYVDIFYTQYNYSYEKVISDDDDIHKQEELEVLDNIKDKFIDHISNLFKNRLALNINALDDQSTPDVDEQEFAIRKSYEFFILNARNNFRNVIAKDMMTKIPQELVEDELFTLTRNLIQEYSPLLKMTPIDFLKYTADEDIIELYDNMDISGNFMRKYTPKLYENNELEVDIISDIDLLHQLSNKITNPEGGI